MNPVNFNQNCEQSVSKYHYWNQSSPSEEDIKETVKFICKAYRKGKIPDEFFETLLTRMLSFYIENFVENKVRKSCRKINNRIYHGLSLLDIF